jgi:mono/diheme cytochrome c family protein
MRKVLCVLIILCVSSFAIAAERTGESLFKGKCGKCHSLERAFSKNKDLKAWQRTTKRMSRYMEQAGDVITEEEAGEIAKYLADRGKVKEPVVVEKDVKKKIEQIVDIEKHEMFDFKKVRVEQFIDPEVCEACHPDQFAQWNGSMHSKAFVDPIWRSATKLFFKDAETSGEILEMKACVKCHTPLGFRSYSISSPGDDYEKLADLPAQGIFCNWCHNISTVKHLGDAGYEVDPGGGEDDPSTMLGPLKDASSPYHPTKYSELHTKSEFCGLCHDVSHAANKLPIEQTYSEWKNSPYNTGDPETTVHCQDCHMRQRPGVPSTGKTDRPDNPGKACVMGPEREHVWTHYFVGANAVVTKLLDSDVHAKMAIERLQNAADLEILQNNDYNKNALSNIKIKVINSGAGHYLPTGITEIRQMWLDVKISDAKGKILLRSGALDKKGGIDKNAVKYSTILGNEMGEPVLNVSKADRILFDYRVPPKGYVLENYAFYIPSGAVSPLNIKATLKYRSASQALARTLLGDKAPQIPVIDMVTIEKKISF